MWPTSFFTLLLLTSVAAVLSSQAQAAESDVFASFEELGTPAGAGAREPNLFVAGNGRTYLSWLEPVADDRFAVRFSVASANGWTPPRTIASDEGLFVNWADFPSIVAFADGRLAAHWLAKNSDKAYAYDVKVAVSLDGGDTWSEPVVPHRDRTPTQHGFVSLLPLPDGDLAISWLDGRSYTATDAFAAADEAAFDVMALRYATLDRGGVLSDEQILDERTCTCCQTSAALTGDDAVLAYRDRSDEEIRDIRVVRLGPTGRWSAPTLVHHDGWEISGCPVNGPAIAADEERVTVAWFTAADDLPRVYVAFSGNGGGSFDAPVRVDQDYPLGRVDLVLLPDGSAVVSWLEMTVAGETFLIRRAAADGGLGPAIALAAAREGRTSGFPRMVRSGDKLYFAWTQSAGSGADASDDRLTVRTAIVRLRAP